MEAGREAHLYRAYIITTSLIIALLLSAVFFGINLRTRSLITAELISSTKAYFETIVATREWNSQHGGVYVEKSDDVESSQFLRNPDIETADGRTLTWKNHAIMTREISDIIGEDRDFAFHMTGLDLINPNNQPDDFEQRALQQFTEGEGAVHEIVEEGGHLYFRYMGPLMATDECKACHRSPNYQPGNVGGGISVTFRIDDVERKLALNLLLIVIFGISTTALLIGTLWFLARRLMLRIIEARRELELKNQELEELDKLKNKFLGIAVHDMRNPLTSIRGFSRLLLADTEAPPSEQQKELLNIIYNASDSMLGLVNDLLDFSAIESGRLELKKKPGSLRELIELKVKMARVIAKEKNITIHTALDDIPDALFDEERIEQVIDNLLSNALKFSPGDSNVYISLSQSGAMAELSIRDEGPGIAEEDLPRIFGEFQRLGPKPTAGEKSTGLGLSIVQKIVSAHEGTVSVESPTEGGTKFTVLLPLVEPDCGQDVEHADKT